MNDKALSNKLNLNTTPLLTLEEIDKEEAFRNLSDQQKHELILLIYEVSIALYHSHYSRHD